MELTSSSISLWPLTRAPFGSDRRSCVSSPPPIYTRSVGPHCPYIPSYFPFLSNQRFSFSPILHRLHQRRRIQSLLQKKLATPTLNRRTKGNHPSCFQTFVQCRAFVHLVNSLQALGASPHTLLLTLLLLRAGKGRPSSKDISGLIARRGLPSPSSPLWHQTPLHGQL